MRLLSSKALAVIVALGFLPFCVPAAFGQEHATAPDNTKINQQDRNKGEPTADQQKMNMPDRDLARKIRRAIVKDKALSTYAHNVKVIAQNGTVTLKGPVRSEEEKRSVEAKAVAIAGQSNVKDELSIAGDADRMKQ